jgi:hypothetical protein
MPLSLIEIAARFLCFRAHFQLVSYFFAEHFEFLGDRREILNRLHPWDRQNEASEMLVNGLPVAWHSLLDCDFDEFRYIPAAERQPLAQPLQFEPVGFGLGSEPFNLARARQERRQRKTKRLID